MAAVVFVPRERSAVVAQVAGEGGEAGNFAGAAGVGIEGNQISGIAGDLMAMAERPDSVPLLPQISCPTQIIVGELDQATPPSDAKLMAEKIPGARLVVIPQAAHLSNLEQPDVFNQIVATFASELGK